MVTLDNSLNVAGPGSFGRWQHPKLLLVLGVLALALTANSLIGGGAFSDRLQWKGVEFFDRTALAEAGGVAAGDLGYAKACARMSQIVQTACGMQQRDHDAEGIRQCVAYELKYTMWDAYGCE